MITHILPITKESIQEWQWRNHMKTIPRIVPRDVTQSNIDIHRTSPLPFHNLLFCTFLTSASNLIINISKPPMMTPPSTDYSAAAPGRSPGRTGVTPILHSSRCIRRLSLKSWTVSVSDEPLNENLCGGPSVTWKYCSNASIRGRVSL